MWSHSGTRLTLALAIALACACGEDTPAAGKEVDSVKKGDDKSSNVADDDDDVAAKDDDSASNSSGSQTAPIDAGRDSGAAPTGPRDSGVPPTSVLDGGKAGDGGSLTSDGGPADMGEGECCDDGKCLCHGPAPTALTSAKGPYATESYDLTGTGCVYYPKDAKPPFAAVSISDGFGGSGGCGRTQTDQWGPLYASWGIVAMIVNTGSGDQPNARGQALTKGITAFKAENMKSGSPLQGKLSGRYGTSGFSMGGGGTTYAAQADKTLLTNVAIMAWGPVNSGISVPSLFICGSSDNTAPCASHGTPSYKGIANTVPKMRVQITSGHAGQPTSGSGKSGQYGLAFQKVFLEGDQRWRPLLVAAPSEETNIK